MVFPSTAVAKEGNTDKPVSEFLNGEGTEGTEGTNGTEVLVVDAAGILYLVHQSEEDTVSHFEDIVDGFCAYFGKVIFVFDDPSAANENDILHERQDAARQQHKARMGEIQRLLLEDEDALMGVVAWLRSLFNGIFGKHALKKAYSRLKESDCQEKENLFKCTMDVQGLLDACCPRRSPAEVFDEALNAVKQKRKAAERKNQQDRRRLKMAKFFGKPDPPTAQPEASAAVEEPAAEEEPEPPIAKARKLLRNLYNRLEKRATTPSADERKKCMEYATLRGYCIQAASEVDGQIAHAANELQKSGMQPVILTTDSDQLVFATSCPLLNFKYIDETSGEPFVREFKRMDEFAALDVKQRALYAALLGCDFSSSPCFERKQFPISPEQFHSAAQVAVPDKIIEAPAQRIETKAALALYLVHHHTAEAAAIFFALSTGKLIGGKISTQDTFCGMIKKAVEAFSTPSIAPFELTDEKLLAFLTGETKLCDETTSTSAEDDAEIQTRPPCSGKDWDYLKATVLRELRTWFVAFLVKKVGLPPGKELHDFTPQTRADTTKATDHTQWKSALNLYRGLLRELSSGLSNKVALRILSADKNEAEMQLRRLTVAQPSDCDPAVDDDVPPGNDAERDVRVVLLDFRIEFLDLLESVRDLFAGKSEKEVKVVAHQVNSWHQQLSWSHLIRSSKRPVRATIKAAVRPRGAARARMLKTLHIKNLAYNECLRLVKDDLEQVGSGEKAFEDFKLFQLSKKQMSTTLEHRLEELPEDSEAYITLHEDGYACVRQEGVVEFAEAIISQRTKRRKYEEYQARRQKISSTEKNEPPRPFTFALRARDAEAMHGSFSVPEEAYNAGHGTFSYLHVVEENTNRPDSERRLLAKRTAAELEDARRTRRKRMNIWYRRNLAARAAAEAAEAAEAAGNPKCGPGPQNKPALEELAASIWARHKIYQTEQIEDASTGEKFTVLQRDANGVIVKRKAVPRYISGAARVVIEPTGEVFIMYVPVPARWP